MLLLFSGVLSLELPEVKQLVLSARSRTARAALFSGVALRDLRAVARGRFGLIRKETLRNDLQRTTAVMAARTEELTYHQPSEAALLAPP
jgi:hypothetical protein